MHNIVLYISIYLFPWLHVLCDLSSINNDRKHAILIIFISGFFQDINIFGQILCRNIRRPFFNRSEALFGQILNKYLEALFSQIQCIDQRPFLVRFYAYIFGGPFQSDSTHRSKALFGQILRIKIFGGPFQSDSTHRLESLYGQILRINIWRPFSVRFNG